MNARKSARNIPHTIGRQLKSGVFLKNPPPAFYPILAHPPPPSLVRSFPERPEADLPLAARRSQQGADNRSMYQAAKQKQERGIKLTAREEEALRDPLGAGAVREVTRKAPPPAWGTKKVRPREIVFPEDKIRRLFFLDHPYEAYRPTTLVEGERITEPEYPQGKEWTELRQRSIFPTPEDCISFISNLVEHHGMPLSKAYPHGVAQFRTLRAEQETANRSARLEAQAHGATFFGEVEKQLRVEEKVLDEWKNARAIQDAFTALTGTGSKRQNVQAALKTANQSASPAKQVQESKWGEVPTRPALDGGEPVKAGFTGGTEFLRRFAAVGATPATEASADQAAQA